MCLLGVMGSAIPTKAGNDLLESDWPWYLFSVAGAYGVYIAPDVRVTRVDAFSTGWIGLDFSNAPGTYGHQFTQVGVMAEFDQLFPFVYAEAGVACISPGSAYTHFDPVRGIYLGCQGAYGDHVAARITSAFSLYRIPSNGQWVAQVSDQFGNAQPLAFTGSTNGAIFRAQVTDETGFNGDSDPLLPIAFYFYHPLYYTGSAYVDWPSTSSSPAYFHSTGLRDNNLEVSVCPSPYGGIYPNVNGNDSRYWYMGNLGDMCGYYFP